MPRVTRQNHRNTRFHPYVKPIYKTKDEDQNTIFIKHHGEMLVMPQEDAEAAPMVEPRRELEHDNLGPDDVERNNRVDALIALLILYTLFSLFIHIRNIMIALRADLDDNVD
ncbi:hypothetical protein PQX77_006313 [Marasmius sp. AFHP31]|nr:hypothetical protein PQX77_006313 [Marasmius sp. AFHP31]